MFAEQYPERAAAVLDAGNARPPLSLRVNRRRICARRLSGRTCDAQGIAARAIGEAGVLARRDRAAVSALPGYAPGWFSVQDAGAQLAAPLLDARKTACACSTPARRLAARPRIWRSSAALDLVALDSRRRAARARRARISRASGLAARLVVADAGDRDAGGTAMPFDRILADVPCTASGIVRRHPDGKWLRRETDIAGFVAQQRRLLDALWPVLERGGMLLYATCSIFGAENERSDRRVSRSATAMRCAFDSHCPREYRRDRRTTLASGGPAQRTITTGFSTPSSKRAESFRTDRAARRIPSMRRILAGLLCLTALLSLPAATIAHADTIGVKSAELLPEDESYVLNAQFDLAFNPTLEEALQKGRLAVFRARVRARAAALVLARPEARAACRCSTA